MTIERKIAKNGTRLYYVGGKRVKRDEAIKAAIENRAGKTFTVEYDTEQNHYFANKIERHVYTDRKVVDTDFNLKIDEYRGFTVMLNGSTIRKFFNKDAAKALSAKIEDSFLGGEHGVKISLDGTISALPETAEDAAEYAVTAEAQDIAIDAEIENAAEAGKSVEDGKLTELFKVREEKRRAALHSTYDSDESKAARAADRDVEEYIGKVAKDLRDIAPEGLSVVASWDSADLDAPKFVVIELATDKRTSYGSIAEVKAALKARDEVTAEDTEVKVEKFTTVKADNAGQAVEILDKLNFRKVAFEYHGDTGEHGLPVVYRHFDGIDADGNGSVFGLIEIVIDGKLDAVRLCNNYREQFTDIKIGDAKYTLGDKGEINLIDEPATDNAEVNEIDAAEYSISQEAFDFAVDFEIGLANVEKLTDETTEVTETELNIAETDLTDDDRDDNETDNRDVFDLLPTVDELNDTRSDDEKAFDEFDAKDCDRDDRFNRGQLHADKLTAKLRKIEPTVTVTYDINEYDEDTFFMTYDGIHGGHCYTLDETEELFHRVKKQQADIAAETATVNALQDKRRSLVEQSSNLLKHKGNGLITVGEYNDKLTEINAEMRYVEVQIAAVKAGDTFDYVDAAEHIKGVYEDLKTCIDIWSREHGLTQAQCEQIYVAAHIDRNFDVEVDREVIKRKIDDFKQADTETDKSDIEVAEDLTERLLKVIPWHAPYMNLTLQDGTKTVASPRTAIIEPDWHGNARFAFVTPWNEIYGRYDTAEQVTGVINRIKACVDGKIPCFTYPTVDELAEKVCVTISVNEPFDTEDDSEILAELEREINSTADVIRYRVDGEQGIFVTVGDEAALCSVEKLFDSYGLHYRHFVYREKAAEHAATKKSA